MYRQFSALHLPQKLFVFITEISSFFIEQFLAHLEMYLKYLLIIYLNKSRDRISWFGKRRLVSLIRSRYSVTWQVVSLMRKFGLFMIGFINVMKLSRLDVTITESQQTDRFKSINWGVKYENDIESDLRKIKILNIFKIFGIQICCESSIESTRRQKKFERVFLLEKHFSRLLKHRRFHL